MMEMRAADLMTHAVLASLGVDQFSQERISQMREMDMRSRLWLSDWGQGHNLMGLPGVEPFLVSRLHPIRELPAVVFQRGQVVSAACEAVSKTTSASLCLRAVITTGLSDQVGRFSPERPLRGRRLRGRSREGQPAWGE